MNGELISDRPADTALAVECVDRAAVQEFLPQLADWLLPGSLYAVEHTWPQLYRNDGGGAFFVIRDGERLLSHCACRMAIRRDGARTEQVCLLGSVATEPAARGLGLAGHLLQHAIETLAPQVSRFLLWAERPELYARAGFVDSGADRCLLLARRPRRSPNGIVRLATVRDHDALHRLHDDKPVRIERSRKTMSTLLTTPGMSTAVLERDGQPVAYACTGKGADLQGHWHELGGSDEDLAALLPEAMHLGDQIESMLLLPPYRAALETMLAPSIVDEIAVPGPMQRPGTASPPHGTPNDSCWIDGLDSV